MPNVLDKAFKSELGKDGVKKEIVMAGKYTPLENHLRDLPDSQQEVTLGFEQIERILDDKLPPSVYEYWAWWANEKAGNHVNARAWANAGWKIANVDFSKKLENKA